MRTDSTGKVWVRGDGARTRAGRVSTLLGEMERDFVTLFRPGGTISPEDKEVIVRAYIGPKWTSDEIEGALAEWAARVKRRAR